MALSSIVLIFVSILCKLLLLQALPDVNNEKLTKLTDESEKTGVPAFEFLTEDGMRVTAVSMPQRKIDFRFGKLHFGVCIAYDSAVVRDASVEVSLVEPGYGSRVSTLSDDGKGVDLVSGDGCYFGVMENCGNYGTSSNPGHYNISITVQKTPTTCVVKEEKRLHVKINGGTQNAFYCASLGDHEGYARFLSGSIDITVCKKPLSGSPITDLKVDFNKNTFTGVVTWTDTWEAETVESMVLAYYPVGIKGYLAGGPVRYFEAFPKYSKRSYVIDFSVLRGKGTHFMMQIEISGYMQDGLKMSNQVTFYTNK